MQRIAKQLLVTIILFAFPVGTFAQTTVDLAEVYEKVVSSIVFITDGVGDDIESTGSGIVMHEDGFIVTAAHVVDTKNEIGVEFYNGDKTKAQIVAISRSEDVALLKADQTPGGLHVARFADSDQVRPGQPVFVIGAPRGWKHSLSSGIISAVRKNNGTLFDSFWSSDVIQTDAAMNPGNSGGGLFNAKGEVIGVASALISGSGDFAGIAMATTSNMTRRRLFDDPLPYIGLHLQRIAPQLAEAMNWPPFECQLVEKLRPGCTAEQAGIQGGEHLADVAGIELILGGDLIYKVNDVPIAELKQAHAELHQIKDGDTMTYSVWREGKMQKISFKIEGLVKIPRLPYMGPATAKEDHRQ